MFDVVWENILVGVGAALLVGLAIRAKNVAYNKYLERQYPIAGEYITTWEDESDGETITNTAPAKLKQRGKRVYGRSKMPGTDIEWHFDGEISETGYINGLYYSTDPHNNSIGNFFFHVNHDGELEGLWSGYQQRNDRILSGRYRFVPVFDAFSIRRLDAADVPAAVDIAEQRLGKEYLSGDLLRQSLEDDSPYFAHVAKVDAEFEAERSLAGNLTDAFLGQGLDIDEGGPGDPVAAEVIGFCLGAVFEKEAFREYLNVPETELPKALRHADRVGVVRTVAVGEGFENRGIGTRLVEQCITECVDRGATALCAVGWETNGAVNVGGIMDYFGFREVARVEEYWREESLEEEFYCETCQELPCTCPAVVFARYQPTKP